MNSWIRIPTLVVAQFIASITFKNPGSGNSRLYIIHSI